MIRSLRHLVIWSLIGYWILGIGYLSSVTATVDPLAVPNNRVGVHILDPQEIETASKLVNSNGGQWGYVTVVLRSNDLDREKWTKFFAASRRLKMIPIVRLATYPDADNWVRPDSFDLVDFANFLSDMPWPTKNRYVVLFNEVNRPNEWGGRVDPLGYATLLLEAKRIFKSRSDDFFLLSAGLDMSAVGAANFYRQISQLQPQWYSAVDGLASHVYSDSAAGGLSYRQEIRLLRSLAYPPRPVFITEAGGVPEVLWQEEGIVAITPFVLFAGSGEFVKYSLLDLSLQPTAQYRQIYSLPKISGSPLLAEVIPTSFAATYAGGSQYQSPVVGLWERITLIWTRLLGYERVVVGQKVFTVEVANTDAKRQQGLSGRPSLGADRGMLFTFDRPATHSFWMKDMNFALDFIWIRGGKVVEITKNVLPPTQTGGEPTVITPTVKIDQVLEVNAGSIDKYGIKVGDIAKRR